MRHLPLYSMIRPHLTFRDADGVPSEPLTRREIVGVMVATGVLWLLIVVMAACGGQG